MSKYYLDYVWKNGSPYGVTPASEEDVKNKITYKLPADPYNKRLSIEKYQQGNYINTIYDSALFDFRHLKLAEQYAWEKNIVEETETAAISNIRNQEDRLILIENYTFIKNRCRECHAYSPHGPLLSIQKIYYCAFDDPFNGTILYDSNAHQVVVKHYEVDNETGEFSTLIKEEWSPVEEK